MSTQGERNAAAREEKIAFARDVLDRAKRAAAKEPGNVALQEHVKTCERSVRFAESS